MTSNLKDCNLTLKRPLDREVKDYYKLVIQVGSLMEMGPSRKKRASATAYSMCNKFKKYSVVGNLVSKLFSIDS